MFLAPTLRATPATLLRRPPSAIRRYAATANTSLPLTDPIHPPEKPETRSQTQEDPLDGYIDVYQRIFLQPGAFDGLSSLSKLYAEYRGNAGHVLDNVLPYEAYPSSSRRCDATHTASRDTVGDGVVLVVHVLQGLDGHVEKMSVCSGFAVGATQAENPGRDLSSDTIITCAHTLEQVSPTLPDQISVRSPRSVSDAPTPRGTIRRFPALMLIHHPLRRQTQTHHTRPVVPPPIRHCRLVHPPIETNTTDNVARHPIPLGRRRKGPQSYVWVA